MEWWCMKLLCYLFKAFKSLVGWEGKVHLYSLVFVPTRVASVVCIEEIHEDPK